MTSFVIRLGMSGWGLLRVVVLSIWRGVWGKPLHVPVAAQEHRMLLCMDCPEYADESDLCEVCYCKMSIKTSLVEAECPLKKW